MVFYFNNMGRGVVFVFLSIFRYGEGHRVGQFYRVGGQQGVRVVL